MQICCGRQESEEELSIIREDFFSGAGEILSYQIVHREASAGVLVLVREQRGLGGEGNET